MNQKSLKSLFVICGIALSVILAGCSTVDGFGKDLNKLGDEIQDAAD